jgi:hypothetical protein
MDIGLACAMRARPETGKKRPLISDLVNHPDDVCAAVSRFLREMHHYEGSGSSLFSVVLQKLRRRESNS